MCMQCKGLFSCRPHLCIRRDACQTVAQRLAPSEKKQKAMALIDSPKIEPLPAQPPQRSPQAVSG